MPRHVPEKKDASNGETRRGAVGERGSGGVRMGEPASRNGDASRKGRRTRGSETSEYPEEKRTKVIPGSSGERNRRQAKPAHGLG